MAVGEIATVAAKMAETSAKVAETGKKAVDIGKRLDVSKEIGPVANKGVDISKRIVQPDVGALKEVSTKDVSKAISEYMKDLKSKSPCVDTLSKCKLSPDKLEVQPPEVVKELRKEFNNSSFKEKIRNEWEVLNGKEWPRYKEDVVNSRGEVVKRAGERYDAHHIQPLKLGGKNEASNITPLDMVKHSDIHSNSGSCKKLLDVVSGGK